MWFGGKAGIYRYDGWDWTVFENSESLHQNPVDLEYLLNRVASQFCNYEKDTGNGIPAEKLGFVFGRFSRSR